ncbi:hypothetical protein MRB53_027894 [Persea americana]|uniref:Uncharacterized protein n=1 Tax=Persea americana TaxID=3435 RepID=A0ACC2KDY6_PERAE|nr:hypothetical protein MRB53_027894 [Persea americana]
MNVTGTLMEEDPENPCRPVDISEIEFAIKQANPCKSLGADVFNVHFFKVCRPIVGCDVSDAIKDFFVEGKLLRVFAKRLRNAMSKIINPDQSAFVRGRSIMDNIILSEDLINAFPSAQGPSKNVR